MAIIQACDDESPCMGRAEGGVDSGNENDMVKSQKTWRERQKLLR